MLKGGTIDRLKAVAPLAAVLLLALVLRLVGITSQSFWVDEGWTSWAISLGWREMLDLLAHDNHPPLYFVLLKLWAGAFGSGDLALRSFSVMCSLAAVASTFALGSLWNRTVGLAGGVLAAVSPPLVRYAQEARMYSLVTLLVAAAGYFLARMLEEKAGGNRRWWPWTLCMAGALYTHHLAWAAFGAQMLAALALSGRRESRRVAVLGGAAVLVLYLPCLPLTVRQVTVGRSMTWRQQVGVQDLAKDVWLFLNLGGGWGKALLTWGAALLTAAGLALGARSGKKRWGLIVLIACLPVLAVWSVQQMQPIYTDRYLLYVAPFHCLLMALGAWELAKLLDPGMPCRGRAGLAPWNSETHSTGMAPGLALAVLVALVIVPTSGALAEYYEGLGPLKSDFRAVAAHVEEAARPGDALALVQTAPPFLHYYEGDLPWEAFPGIGVEDYVSSEEEVARKLSRIARPGSVVWWIGHTWDISDPQNLVEAQLREHGVYWDELWWHDSPRQEPIRMAAYVMSDVDFGRTPRTALGANFGGQVELTSYDLQRDRAGIYVGLWWRALSRPERHYNAFVHLIDGEGEIVAQGDHLPVNPFYPIGRWEPRDVWRDEHRLALPEGVEEGDLGLRVGLSWGEEGEHQLPIVGESVPGRGWMGQTYLILPLESECQSSQAGCGGES